MSKGSGNKHWWAETLWFCAGMMWMWVLIEKWGLL